MSALDVPEGYEPCNVKCPQCGEDSFFDYRRNGPHMAVYCIGCGCFVTYVPKFDLNVWKRKVKERDGYICQKCKKPFTSHSLDAHHKMPIWFMEELKYDLNNGITLCKTCHRTLHGYDGTIKDTIKED